MEFPKVDLLRVKPGDFVIVPPGAPLRGLTLSTLAKLGISTGCTTRSLNSFDAVKRAFFANAPGALPLVFLVTRTVERAMVSAPRQHALALISNTPAEARFMVPAVRSAQLMRVPLAGPVHPSLAQHLDEYAVNAASSLKRPPSSFLLESNNGRVGVFPDVAGAAAWQACKHQATGGVREVFATAETRAAADRDPPRKTWPEPGERQDAPLEGDKFRRLMTEMWEQGSRFGAERFSAVHVEAKFLNAAAKRGAVAVRDESGALRKWLARRAMQESAATIAANWELRARALVLFEAMLRDDLKAARARVLRWKAMAREFGMPGDSRRAVQALEKAAMPEGR